MKLTSPWSAVVALTLLAAGAPGEVTTSRMIISSGQFPLLSAEVAVMNASGGITSLGTFTPNPSGLIDLTFTLDSTDLAVLELQNFGAEGTAGGILDITAGLPMPAAAVAIPAFMKNARKAKVNEAEVPLAGPLGFDFLAGALLLPGGGNSHIVSHESIPEILSFSDILATDASGIAITGSYFAASYTQLFQVPAPGPAGVLLSAALVGASRRRR